MVLNPYEGNVARTIKATCQQVSIANLTRQGAYAATGVITLWEITEK